MELGKIKEIAKSCIANCDEMALMGDEARERLTIGCMIEKSEVNCTFYIPGIKPEDAIVVAEVIIERSTGEVKEKHVLSQNFEGL